MLESYMNMLVRSSRNVKDIIQLKAYSTKKIEREPEVLDEALQEATSANAILLYRSTGGFWETVEERLREFGRDIPVICCGHDPSYWAFSTCKAEVVATVYSYISINGEENFTNMLKYIARETGGMDIEAEEPKPVPWEGLYHPDAAGIFTDIKAYLNWYGTHRLAAHKEQRFKQKEQQSKGTIGLLLSRHYWVNNNLEVDNTLIRALEFQGFDVIPAFAYAIKDEEKGCRGGGEVVSEYFFREDGTPRIDAFVKIPIFFLGGSKSGTDDRHEEVAKGGIDILKRFDVPVFTPVSSYSKTIEEWEKDMDGLGADIAWSITMPEFEGVIEPIIIGGASREAGGLERRMPIEERCRKVVQRISNWVKLGQKSVGKRRVAFILHNNPCASVEATVGGGAHLDTLESVAILMERMKAAGYSVDPPADGKELIDTIMDCKAISEFRWTTVDEIVNKGGVLKQVTKDEYREWFETLSMRVKNRVNDAWGRPPGEEKEGVPAAMVYNGRILVTGVNYGNAVVCVQPKRGCAGPKCDGRVCKILHDPDIPPTHQYLATYRYLERDFGADVIVHVGTHGNLEFLPGKGTALSRDCYPDMSIGEMPHLYIYNADNPPEGVIAKRRSYATLVDHMQTVMIQGGLYEELEELGRFLGDYEQVKGLDPGREHSLQHLIMESVKKTHVDKEIKISIKDEHGKLKKHRMSELGDDEIHSVSFDEIARAVHGALSLTRNTQIQDGMHVFGQLPLEEMRVDFINSILLYDAGESVSLRKIISNMMGLNLSDMLADTGMVCPRSKKSYGQLLEEINQLSRGFIKFVLEDNDASATDCFAKVFSGHRFDVSKEISHQLDLVKKRVFDLDNRINESKEIESLLHGFEGGYIPPGPSGLISRGRDDVLPTGRNFYALDPHRIPTKAAWKIGQQLAEAVIEKHRQEEGRIPENVAIYWMCSDIMWADGEGMAQIFHLLGVKPTWQPNGRVNGFEIIPVEELGRPRVDVTIRVSGITRDNFPNCMELVDEAVQAVAILKETSEMNFVRKHTIAQIDAAGGDAEDKAVLRDATLRIFASKPGTYQPGTNLAIYASAWKDEKDLSDIFVYWNGYAYGKGVFGEKKYRQLAENLKTVDITYNKVVTDEYDLFGCCCYFGTHGGMTAAARQMSGKAVKTYYGDTREPEHVEIRDLADEVRRIVRTKLLNPKWIEGVKRHGYKGAGDISSRVGRVYGWEATTQEVDDWIFDDITKTFILNPENREFFEQNNPWALEEIGRRLLEAEGRGLWDADPDVLEGLKEYYLEIEGWIEDRMGDVTGDFQGGSVDIMTSEDVSNWGEVMQDVKETLKGFGK